MEVFSQYVQHGTCKRFVFFGQILLNTFYADMEGTNGDRTRQSAVQVPLFSQVHVYYILHLLGRRTLLFVVSVNKNIKKKKGNTDLKII